jgi:hypothetical protein
MKRNVASGLVAVILVLSVAAPVAAAAPSNDDISSPTPVTVPSQTTQSTADATSAPTDPQDCGSNGPSVWFSYEAATDQRVRVRTLESDYDTVLTVGVADGGGIAVIDCNDDVFDLTSQVIFDATAGTTYLFAVATFGGVGGNLVLTVDVAPPPPTLSLTVDPTGTFTPDGVAVIRGTISCTDLESAGLEVSLEQIVGRQVIRGGAFDGLACGPDPVPWSMTIQGGTGKFLGGRATVAVYAFGCAGECIEVFETATIRLRR